MESGTGTKLLMLLWAVCCKRALADGPIGYPVIEVTNGGPWGDWALPEMCSDGYFASGFSLKVRALGLGGGGDGMGPWSQGWQSPDSSSLPR